MLETKKEPDIKGVLARFGKLLMNLYMWSAFYAFQGIAVKLILRGNTEGLWSDSWQRFLWGHYHMWFVFPILGFYLLLPILQKICENKVVIEYFLWLWLLTAFIIPIAASFLKLDWINTWIYKLNILIGYPGYFLLGYYLKKYPLSKKIQIPVYIGGVVGFLYIVTGTILQSYIQDIYCDSFFSPGSWNVFLYVTAIFTFFANRNEMNFGYSLVRKTARYSFVIYMVHPFFLEKLNMMGITTISFSSLFSVPVLTFLIFICSYAVAAVIHRIPYLNKWIL